MKKEVNVMTDFEALKEELLYHMIVDYDKENEVITLDNGVKIAIEETEQDCCASACGGWENIVFNSAITNVLPIETERWHDDDTYGCCATIKVLHLDQTICEASGNADAGNGGYYYSIASFVVKYPEQEKENIIHFVSSCD